MRRLIEGTTIYFAVTDTTVDGEGIIKLVRRRSNWMEDQVLATIDKKTNNKLVIVDHKIFKTLDILRNLNKFLQEYGAHSLPALKKTKVFGTFLADNYGLERYREYTVGNTFGFG